MDAGIPIIAFDPAGIWRWLRVANKGAGYPVVVAGGEQPDLPLTPDGAPEIVRAAMREGVSLVVDLYSMKLSKADWHRIVERSVRVLLYENKAHAARPARRALTPRSRSWRAWVATRSSATR